MTIKRVKGIVYASIISILVYSAFNLISVIKFMIENGVPDVFPIIMSVSAFVVFSFEVVILVLVKSGIVNLYSEMDKKELLI